MSIVHPVPGEDTPMDLWEGARRGQLLIQRCSACQRTWAVRLPSCPSCASQAAQVIAVSGRGQLHSWVVTHHPFDPSFAVALPYAVAMVELEEGARLFALVDPNTDLGLLAGGRPVEVRVTDLDGTPSLACRVLGEDE